MKHAENRTVVPKGVPKHGTLFRGQAKRAGHVKISAYRSITIEDINYPLISAAVPTTRNHVKACNLCKLPMCLIRPRKLLKRILGDVPENSKASDAAGPFGTARY
jgi:hypothetical protein